MPKLRGRSAFFGLILVCILVYGVVVALDPWAMHIGGRWTPFLTWHGSGKLLTKGGVGYPLYVSFYPSSHFSQLHLDGLRPTGGLQGSGWLCTSPGVTQYMTLSGTIFGGWGNTDGALMSFRLLEQKIIDVGQGQGFFDLTGKWHGPQLIMDDRNHVPNTFRSGLRIEHASVILEWNTWSDFKSECANATIHPVHP
ncbi:MAG TPA: hypothetical protein VI685_16385 [Candidatus Angelobacter sp.]